MDLFDEYRDVLAFNGRDQITRRGTLPLEQRIDFTQYVPKRRGAAITQPIPNTTDDRMRTIHPVRDRLHDPGRRLGTDERPITLTISRIANADRNPTDAHRLDHSRMHHSRTKHRELRGLIVRNDGNRPRARYKIRIRSLHAINIRPDLYLISLQRRADECRGVIGAAATERSRNARER